MNMMLQGLLLLAVWAVLLFVVGCGETCPPGFLPDPIPEPPPRWMRHQQEPTFPFGLPVNQAKQLRELDSLLSRIEQARAKVKIPRLVLPGPLSAEEVQDFTIAEYEAELHRLCAEMDRPQSQPMGYVNQFQHIGPKRVRYSLGSSGYHCMVGTVANAVVEPIGDPPQRYHVTITLTDGRERHFMEKERPDIPIGAEVQLDFWPARLVEVHNLDEDD